MLHRDQSTNMSPFGTEVASSKLDVGVTFGDVVVS